MGLVELNNHRLENTRVLCPDGQLGVSRWFCMMGHVVMMSVITESGQLQKLFVSDDFKRNEEILFENQ